ncbi:MAG: heavy metal translocating P-type ATPase [Acidimicrobiales bacterium]|nr:heavy metal translocating P-type ATPase [Acidimicrobiales bacterium]
MTEKTTLELQVLLPDAHDARDRCVELLVGTLSEARGIDDVHVVDGEGTEPARLCMHYTPERIGVGRIRQLANATGAELTSRYRHLLWPVEGIGHPRRAAHVSERIRELPGVVEAEVTTGVARVEIDTDAGSVEDVERVLAELDVRRRNVGGREPEADSHGAEGHDHGEGEHHHGGPFGERSEVIFAVASGVFLAVGYLLEVFTDVPSGVSTALYVLAYLGGGWFTTIEAFETIRRGKFEIDFLMLVAAAGAAALGELAEGALLLFLFSIGHALEGYALGRARRAIEALADLAPPTARVRRNGAVEEIPVEELVTGDTVLVRTNERIPADGFVLTGTSSVNQAALTGESMPVDKGPVEDPEAAGRNPEGVSSTNRLFTGTINGPGALEMVVTRTSADSMLAKVVTMVQEAETQASPTQRFTDRFQRVFVPSVLALVVALLAGGPILGRPFDETFYRAMAVLVAASPCALAIATPSAVLAAVARAGRAGVLIKGGGPLEELGAVRAIAFDKTGTLTVGEPRLTDVVPADGVAESELLATAVAVERGSDHPLAQAVVDGGLERLDEAPTAEATDVQSKTGQGITATLDDKPAWIGNPDLFASASIDLPHDVTDAVALLKRRGRTLMVVRHGDRFLGVLGLMDRARPAAREMLASLRDLGISRTVLLSGDHQAAAKAVATEVGVDEGWGDLMPDEKVTAIDELRSAEGRVAMVGDGVNDAPALAHASVGIAMGAAGSDVALETADVALMGDDLSRLPFAIELGRRARRNIRQNLIVSLGIVAFLIPATIFGWLGIGPAVVVHEGSTLLVVGNALRLLAFRDRTERGGPDSDPAEESTEPTAATSR